MPRHQEVRSGGYTVFSAKVRVDVDWKRYEVSYRPPRMVEDTVDQVLAAHVGHAVD